MSSFFGLMSLNSQGDPGGGASSSSEVLRHQQQQMNLNNNNYYYDNNESLFSMPSLSEHQVRQQQQQQYQQQQQWVEEERPWSFGNDTKTDGNATNDNIADNNNIPLSKEAETLIANGMRYLSLREREQVTHAVHGVEDPLEESPTMIQQSLEQLNKELDSYIIRKQQEEGFGHTGDTSTSTGDDEVDDPLYYVLTTAPSYIRTTKFLLMFLRATEFQAEESVNKMVKFFNVKLKLFGVESLGRDITISQDFSAPQDEDVLYCGYTHLLPGRDRAGRAIVLYLSDRRIGKSTKSIVRFFRSLLCLCVVCVCLPCQAFCLVLTFGRLVSEYYERCHTHHPTYEIIYATYNIKCIHNAY